MCWSRDTLQASKPIREAEKQLPRERKAWEEVAVLEIGFRP